MLTLPVTSLTPPLPQASHEEGSLVQGPEPVPACPQARLPPRHPTALSAPSAPLLPHGPWVSLRTLVPDHVQDGVLHLDSAVGVRSPASCSTHSQRPAPARGCAGGSCQRGRTGASVRSLGSPPERPDRPCDRGTARRTPPAAAPSSPTRDGRLPLVCRCRTSVPTRALSLGLISLLSLGGSRLQAAVRPVIQSQQRLPEELAVTFN